MQRNNHYFIHLTSSKRVVEYAIKCNALHFTVSTKNIIIIIIQRFVFAQRRQHKLKYEIVR